MGRKKGLSVEERDIIIVEVGKGTCNEDIAKILGRHVDTIKRYLKSPSPRKSRSDRGGSKTVTARGMRKIVRQVRHRGGQTSKSIFLQAGFPNVSRTTRNRILKNFATVRSSVKRPPLTKRHKILRLEWARQYLKMDMSRVLFTDESRATLDGPDGWSNGWLYFGDERHQRLRRQQGGGGVMIWAGIIGDKLVGPYRIPQGVKVTSAAYCQFLQEVFVPWLDDIPLSTLRDLVFMHDNAPSHSARATQTFLGSLGIEGEKLMKWPPCSPDLNPIENFWAIIKRHIYADGRQFFSNEDLWEAIKVASESVPSSTIKNLTDSVDNRLFEVIKRSGAHVGK